MECDYYESIYFLVFAMAQSKTVNTIFQTNSQAETKVVTGATVIAANPINNLIELATATFAPITNGLLGGLGSNLLAESKKYDLTKFKNVFDPAGFKDRAKTLGTNLTKNLDSLGGKVLNDVLTNSGYLGDNKEIVAGLLGATKGKPISEIIKYQSNNVKAVINGVESTIKDIKNFDTDSLGSVMTMMGAIMGDPSMAQLIDSSAEMTMLKTLNDAAIYLGIPKAIDHILDYKKDDASARRLLLSDGLPNAVSQSDLYYISRTIDECGVGSILSRQPNIISDILANYTLPQGEWDPQPQHLEQLVATLTRISSTWQFAKVGGEQKIDLNILYKANATARQVLMFDPNLVPAIVIANNFPSQPVKPFFKRCYPYY